MTPESWKEWRSTPQTQEFLRAWAEKIPELRETAMESIAMDAVDETALTIARWQGIIEGIQMVIEGEFDE